MSFEKPGAESINPKDKARWAESGRSNLESLKMPALLKKLASEALDTPQLSTHHNEGMYMASHLGMMMENVEAIANGKFDFNVVGLAPELKTEAKTLIIKAIRANLADMKIYSYLHDIEKPSLMAMKYKDKKRRQKVITLDMWRRVAAKLGDDETKIRDFWAKKGVASITYRHEAELTKTGEDKDHGPEAYDKIKKLEATDPETANYLKERQLLLIGVQNHEMHFQVFSGSKTPDNYRKYVADKFKEEEVAFIFAACFIDIASSLNADGKADYQGFRNMVEARAAYNLLQNFLKETPGLKENQIGNLYNANGLEDLRKKIEAIKNPPKKNLTPDQIELVLSRASELKISEELKADFEIAIRSDDFAKALAGNKKMNKSLIGQIKKILQENAR